MYQDCCMRATKVDDSPIFYIRLKIQAYLYKKCCKQQYSKEALSWYYFNPKGMIILPYDDKQIVLLTSMRNNNPELQYTGKKKIPSSSYNKLLRRVAFRILSNILSKIHDGALLRK